MSTPPAGTTTTPPAGTPTTPPAGIPPPAAGAPTVPPAHTPLTSRTTPPPAQGTAGPPAGGASSSGTEGNTLAARYLNVNPFDAADITSVPTLATLQHAKYEPTAGSVATKKQVGAVAEIWKKCGVPAENIAGIAHELARLCADVGSSPYTFFHGSLQSCPEHPTQHLVTLLRTCCTLRQFCSYFAPVVWNMMIETNLPPARWAACGFKEQTKFAAFDFFEAVTSPAAIPMLPTRQPSPEELLAHATNRDVFLYKAAKAAGPYAANQVMLHNGRKGTTPLIAAPDDD